MQKLREKLYGEGDSQLHSKHFLFLLTKLILAQCRILRMHQKKLKGKPKQNRVSKKIAGSLEK